MPKKTTKRKTSRKPKASLRAKLFRNGGSQAVRLPKSCRFPDDQTEVSVHREGSRIILEEVDAGWSKEFLACLGAWKGEIPRLKQTPLHKMRNPFA